MKTLTRAVVLCGVLAPLAAGCEFQRTSTALAPSGLETGGAGGNAGAGALMGLWGSSASLDAASLKTCTNFNWNIASQTPTAISGQFQAVCLGSYTISGTASGQLEGTSVVRVLVNATAVLPGLGSCPVTLTSTGTIEGDALRLPYTAQTCVGNFSGTETLRRRSPASPPPAPEPLPPAPPPDPVPPPPPGAPRADEIDLGSAVIMLGPRDVGSWPQTSTITGTKAETGALCIWHTELGRWPNTIFFDDPNTRVEGNQWVFANIGGRWYGGAADWYRPGQACKDVNANSIAGDAFYQDNHEPLRSWRPRPGETFGVMSTTPARAWPAMRTRDERTNVILIRWGG